MILTLKRKLELVNMTKLFIFLLYECDEALFPETMARTKLFILPPAIYRFLYQQNLRSQRDISFYFLFFK